MGGSGGSGNVYGAEGFEVSEQNAGPCLEVLSAVREGQELSGLDQVAVERVLLTDTHRTRHGDDVNQAEVHRSYWVGVVVEETDQSQIVRASNLELLGD